MSQIVLHRSGTDPDFTYRKRLDVDFSHLLGVCVCVHDGFMCVFPNGVLHLLISSQQKCVWINPGQKNLNRGLLS